MTVSIAIATYNGERFLREQLDSLYRQTRLPDEVVVSDDGSTDGTIAILEAYHQRYGLKYSTHTQPMGVNRNFADAFRMTTGDYVCICDQDDIWFDNKVEVLYEAIHNTNPNIPVAVSSSRIDIDAAGRQVAPDLIYAPSRGCFSTLLDTGCSQGCTMIMNRCLVEKVLHCYQTKEGVNDYLYDVLASVTAAIFGEKINLGQPLMYYRHHDKNVVDKLRIGRYTFWQKVRDMPTYYPFLLDYRIRELAITDRLFAEEAMREDIRLFLHRMTALSQVKTIWQGLRIICMLPEITWAKKLKTLCLTPVAKTLKRIEQTCSLAK